MMAIKRKLCEKKANQTISEDNIDQKENSTLIDETPNLEESNSDPIKKSNKHFKLPDASELQELITVNEENEIEKKEDETEISDELLFDDTHVDSNDPSDTLGDTPKLDPSLSEGVD